MRSIALRRPARARGSASAYPPVAILPLLGVIGVMMSRSWSMVAVQSFTPVWYKSLGYTASFYGPLATTIILASAMGTVGSGQLADRFGRRAIIIGALILSVPAVLLYAQFTGPVAFVTGALVGFLAASTGPLMLVMAQQLMAGRQGMASGLILGLGFVTGAIGAPVTGAMGDAWGLQAAMRFQAVVMVATLAIAWFLPSEGRLSALSRKAPAAPHPAPPVATPALAGAERRAEE